MYDCWLDFYLFHVTLQLSQINNKEKKYLEKKKRERKKIKTNRL